MSAPRATLAALPTPLMRARRLEHALGHRHPILVKRDDLTGFGAAGNKARALEFLVGAALGAGCDRLVTGGGAGSNFIAGAALAARATGLGCELVIPGDPTAARSPNLAIARRAGARLHALGSEDRSRLDDAVTALAAELVAAGHRPYPMPRGGSTPVGALGFAVAVEELEQQLAGVEPALVVLAVGSGGSLAGLVAGQAPWPLLGASVSRPVAEIEAKVLAIAGRSPVGPLRFVDARGPGFGQPSTQDQAAAGLALETEGLLLDATYTAKSFAVLLDHLPDGPAVFWHTGGLVSAVTEQVGKGVGREPANT